MSDARETSLADRAFRVLARRDYSRTEMRSYLQRYCDDAEQVAALIGELETRGYLSETRVAEAVVRKRAERVSAARVRQELVRRGISDEAVNAATSSLAAADLQTATRLWRKRFGTAAATREEREKQLRFLVNRGFSHGTALKVLQTTERHDDADEEA